jgi:AraC family transcriptional regulator of arabinose operon
MDISATAILSGGEASCAPGHTFHRDPGFPYYTLGLMLTGRVRVRYGAEEIESPAGTLGLTAPNTPYSVQVPEAHREIWLFFLPRPEWRRWLNWGRPDHAPAGGCRVTLTDRVSRVQITRGMRQALAYSQSRLPAGPRLTELALEQVLILAASLSAGGGALDERLERVLRAMRHDLARPWREAELAAIATLSTSRFAHLFHEKLAVSPLRHLEQLRLERAKSLLLGTSSPVKEIAAEVGYPDALHFSTRFRRLVGRSPRAYRQCPMEG